MFDKKSISQTTQAEYKSDKKYTDPVDHVDLVNSLELIPLTLKTCKSSMSYGNLYSVTTLVKTLSNTFKGTLNRSLSMKNISHNTSISVPTEVSVTERESYFSPIIDKISDKESCQNIQRNESHSNLDIETCCENHVIDSHFVDSEESSELKESRQSELSLSSLNKIEGINNDNNIDGDYSDYKKQEQIKIWKNILKNIIHYYTHFLMFVIFEILFYFNYVVEYERKLVYGMISGLMKSVVDNDVIDVSQNKKCDFYDKVCKTFVKGQTSKENTDIYENALYLIYGMSGFLMILIVIETNMFKQMSTFPKEFGKSLLLMIFVGAFDYLFFSFFILKYKIINTGDLMCYLYEHDDTGCQNVNPNMLFYFNS